MANGNLNRIEQGSLVPCAKWCRAWELLRHENLL